MAYFVRYDIFFRSRKNRVKYEGEVDIIPPRVTSGIEKHSYSIRALLMGGHRSFNGHACWDSAYRSCFQRKKIYIPLYYNHN